MRTLEVLFSPFGTISAKEAESAVKRLHAVVSVFVLIFMGGLNFEVQQTGLKFRFDRPRVAF